MKKTHRYEDIDFGTEPWASYLWGVPGQEVLDRNIDHLIEELTDGMDMPEGTLTLTAWVRHEIDEDEEKRLVARALDSLWDELDEEYGNPDAFEDRQQPDAEDEAATREWVKGILSSFEVWTCDETDQQVVVDVRKWAELKAPHWLEEERIG